MFSEKEEFHNRPFKTIKYLQVVLKTTNKYSINFFIQLCTA